MTTQPHKPNLDWVDDPDWKAKLQQAWQDYEVNPQPHLLHRYACLIDKASVVVGVVHFSELSPGMGNDVAPSVNDMW